MPYAIAFPDWNSLDSVRRAHSDLEAAAHVFFALLVFFDILAHLSTNDKKKTLLEKIGLCCFAIAVFSRSSGISIRAEERYFIRADNWVFGCRGEGSFN
jgi:hypothetical protein